jgi:NADPH-dependent curcumin reductase CurA
LDGLERAPNGLMGMLRGDNFGKLIVKVADG